VLHPEKQPGVSMQVVARSSPEATAEGQAPIELRFTSEIQPKGARGSQVMAAALQGKIRSAFGGAPPAAGAAPSRVLVVGSSQFFANPLVRAGNPPPVAGVTPLGDEDLQMLGQIYAQKYLTATILVLKNTLDWMTTDEGLARCHAEPGR
jgi:hypothetical protein